MCCVALFPFGITGGQPTLVPEALQEMGGTFRLPVMDEVQRHGIGILDVVPYGVVRVGLGAYRYPHPGPSGR